MRLVVLGVCKKNIVGLASNNCVPRTFVLSYLFNMGGEPFNFGQFGLRSVIGITCIFMQRNYVLFMLYMRVFGQEMESYNFFQMFFCKVLK